MSSRITVVCDICGCDMVEVEEGGKRPDTGIWFKGGQCGLSDVCDNCRNTVTIAAAWTVLQLRMDTSRHRHEEAATSANVQLAEAAEGVQRE